MSKALVKPAVLLVCLHSGTALSQDRHGVRDDPAVEPLSEALLESMAGTDEDDEMWDILTSDILIPELDDDPVADIRSGELSDD